MRQALAGRTLAGRIYAILLAATITIQLLSLVTILAVGTHDSRDQLFRLLADDIAFVHRFLTSMPKEQRPHWMKDLSRGYLSMSLVDDASLPATDDPDDLEDLMHHVTRRLAGLTVAHSLEEPSTNVIVVRLDENQHLLIRMPEETPFAMPSIGTVAAYLVLIAFVVMLVARYAVRVALRPLARFTEAAAALTRNIDSPPLPAEGAAEVREANATFNAMQAQLQRNLHERTRILASISHDLKTPLTRLRLRMSALPATNEKGAAERDIDEMEALIQEGLDYARSEQVREASEPIDLDAMIEILVEGAEDLGRAVTVIGKAGEPVVCAPRATQRAVRNLLDNALAYGSDVEIVVEPAAAVAPVAIRIRDRGPGIPAAELERVFEPFYRIESSRNRGSGGTGLGLTIARNLLQAQQARLRLANRPGGGLEATVTFKSPASPTQAGSEVFV